MSTDEAGVVSVLSQYKLPAPFSVSRLGHGFVNENLRIVDADGHSYCLRGYRRVPSPGRLAFQLEFQRHLRDCDVPVADLVRPAAGGDAVSGDGVYWVLFTWVQGTDYSFDDIDQACAAAVTLARFHEAGVSFRPTGWEPPVVGQGSFWYRRFETAAEQPERLRRLFPDATLRGDLDFSIEWWQAFAREWPAERVASLQNAWLHSDYHGRNLAFDGRQVVAVFDFDDVWHGPRVCDVAQGTFNFGRKMRGIAYPEGRELRSASARAFLEAYASEAPLSREELEAVPALIRAVYPPNAFQLSWMKEHGGDYVARFRRDVEITRQVGVEVEHLLASWA